MQIPGREGNALLTVVPVADRQLSQFRLDYSSGLSYAAELELTLDGDVLLLIGFFNGRTVEVGSIDIAVDDETAKRVVKKINEKKNSSLSVDQLLDWLGTEFVYRQKGGSDLFFTSIGREEPNDGDEQQQEKGRSESGGAFDFVEIQDAEKLPTAFMIVGRRYLAAVAKRSMGHGREIFVLSKLHNRPREALQKPHL